MQFMTIVLSLFGRGGRRPRKSVRYRPEVTALEVPGAAAPNPWAEFAGMFKDDPYLEEVVEIMAENRRTMDADPDVP